jgi:hypothetical protein
MHEAPLTACAPDPLRIVMRCAGTLRAKARYVFDILCLARGIPVEHADMPPRAGAWLLYGEARPGVDPLHRCVAVTHTSSSWEYLVGEEEPRAGRAPPAHPFVPTTPSETEASPQIPFDLPASAFYLLSSWAERNNPPKTESRQLYSTSLFARRNLPQDLLDRYLDRLMTSLDIVTQRTGQAPWTRLGWPNGSHYAVVLSHDIDFLPVRRIDTVAQGIKSIARHLLRHRDPADAARAAVGLARALLAGEDPYGCVPQIIAKERRLGVRASFQVAVGHGHPKDVNYRIEDERVCAYLRAIVDAGFDLCLHGSYRSTQDPARYVKEADLLARRLHRPRGSRQHFLSFDYDALFGAQERAGIQYDMSMGYPDQVGPRAGFSYPYFPYCLAEDRPYDVVEVSLVLMDVTLRGYLGLNAMRAWPKVYDVLEALRRKRGCASLVWHPIVFGGARDPGYDTLFSRAVEHVQATGGAATDGCTINRFWRSQARGYASFAHISEGWRTTGASA